MTTFTPEQIATLKRDIGDIDFNDTIEEFACRLQHCKIYIEQLEREKHDAALQFLADQAQVSDDRITEILLANGFKLKEQPGGSMALNPYVVKGVREILKAAQHVAQVPFGWAIRGTILREDFKLWTYDQKESVDHLVDYRYDGKIVYEIIPLYTAPQPPSPIAEQAPINMVLFCPMCGVQHIDAPDQRSEDWINPPHKSHLCHGCGAVWRPADIPTNGVQAIKSKGKNDSMVKPPIAEQGSQVDERADGIAKLKNAFLDFSRTNQSQHDAFTFASGWNAHALLNTEQKDAK